VVNVDLAMDAWIDEVKRVDSDMLYYIECYEMEVRNI